LTFESETIDFSDDLIESDSQTFSPFSIVHVLKDPLNKSVVLMTVSSVFVTQSLVLNSQLVAVVNHSSENLWGGKSISSHAGEFSKDSLESILFDALNSFKSINQFFESMAVTTKMLMDCDSVKETSIAKWWWSNSVDSYLYLWDINLLDFWGDVNFSDYFLDLWGDVNFSDYWCWLINFFDNFLSDLRSWNSNLSDCLSDFWLDNNFTLNNCGFWLEFNLSGHLSDFWLWLENLSDDSWFDSLFDNLSNWSRINWLVKLEWPTEITKGNVVSTLLSEVVGPFGNISWSVGSSNLLEDLT